MAHSVIGTAVSWGVDKEWSIRSGCIRQWVSESGERERERENE